MSLITVLYDERVDELVVTEVTGSELLVTELDDEEILLVTEIALNGEDGKDGLPGPSPYEEWLLRGNEGTYDDFLRSITNGGLGDLADAISTDPNNRLKQGNDNKLFVEDEWTPDPLAFYLLARG